MNLFAGLVIANLFCAMSQQSLFKNFVAPPNKYIIFNIHKLKRSLTKLDSYVLKSYFKKQLFNQEITEQSQYLSKFSTNTQWRIEIQVQNHFNNACCNEIVCQVPKYAPYLNYH